jgi:tetratricopeptide (TPR) repeat protein
MRGNQQYVDGNFEQSIKTYESVLDSGYEAPELYFNLGNAYFKSHKLTPAILNYERAILLAPHDDDIAYNLDLARSYVLDKIDLLPQLFLKDWHMKVVRLFHSDIWAYISIFFFILSLFLFSLYLFKQGYRIKRVAFWIGLLCLFISISSFIFSYHHKQLISNHNKAIIFTPAVTVKSSPDNSGTDLFVIHEGTKVTIEDTLGLWAEIRLEDGNKGWLFRSDIEKI